MNSIQPGLHRTARLTQLFKGDLDALAEGALKQALTERAVSGEDLLRVATLLTQNYHKSFGSPALWRPEPCAAPGVEEER